MEYQGTVKFFKSDNGWGFLMINGVDMRNSNVFCHINNIKNQVALRQGDRVRFTIGTDPRSGRQQAFNVDIID